MFYGFKDVTREVIEAKSELFSSGEHMFAGGRGGMHNNLLAKLRFSKVFAWLNLYTHLWYSKLPPAFAYSKQATCSQPKSHSFKVFLNAFTNRNTILPSFITEPFYRASVISLCISI